jgi:glycosyltransferase involved in cell wall biosynthesis
LSERGVSVVLCCHNSAGRIGPTLAHLADQRDPGVPWEVVVVDNASEDGTGAMVSSLWPAGAPAPLRVVAEPHLGVTFARYTGIDASRYELIAFVDDDNWLDPGWLAVAVETMAADGRIGACGGRAVGEFEVDPPAWFKAMKVAPGIGGMGPVAHDPAWKGQCLRGAGLVVRRSAVEDLRRRGFTSVMRSRTGSSLQSGEDTELCLALARIGWRLWYEPRLRLIHYMPAPRLSWTYLCRWHRGYGESMIWLNPYGRAFQREANPWFRVRLRRSWVYQIVRIVVTMLVAFPRAAGKRRSGTIPGDPDFLQVEVCRGKIMALLAARSRYGANFRTWESWALAREPGLPAEDRGP